MASCPAMPNWDWWTGDVTAETHETRGNGFSLGTLTSETDRRMMRQRLPCSYSRGSGAYPGAKQPATGETDEIPETKPETERHVRDPRILVRQTAADS
jgi:hypothetical protein